MSNYSLDPARNCGPKRITPDHSGKARSPSLSAKGRKRQRAPSQVSTASRRAGGTEPSHAFPNYTDVSKPPPPPPQQQPMNQYAFLACNIPRTLLILTYARAGAAARRAVGMRLANNGPTYESISRSPAYTMHDTHARLGTARLGSAPLPVLASLSAFRGDTWVRREQITPRERASQTHPKSRLDAI